MYALFARRDHPPGWGLTSRSEQPPAAHGYSLVAVRCRDEAQLREATAMVCEGEFTGPGRPGDKYADGYLNGWFGGRFDFVATVTGEFTVDGGGRARLFGDNRAVFVFDADELRN